MSAIPMGRPGKWADAIEDDFDEGSATPSTAIGPTFETPMDEHGIRVVVHYEERGGDTYKVTRRIKQTRVQKWTNPEITRRKAMRKFGKAAESNAQDDRQLVVQSQEDIRVELTKRAAIEELAEEEFYLESANIALSFDPAMKAWTDLYRRKQAECEEAARAGEPTAALEANALAKAAEHTVRAYVPPYLRGKDVAAHAAVLQQQQQEATVRVTNLSEEINDGDLRELFGQVGRLQRVYLARDRDTGAPRGFAFVTYYSRQEAERAIEKLNGHGYDNLIMQVQIAKPRP